MKGGKLWKEQAWELFIGARGGGLVKMWKVSGSLRKAAQHENKQENVFVKFYDIYA